MFARQPVNGCLYANVANECTLITTKTTTRGNKQTKHREQKKWAFLGITETNVGSLLCVSIIHCLFIFS